MTSPYSPNQHYPAAPPQRGLSIASLALGAGGLVFGWAFVGLPSIAAVVLGHLALRREPEGRSLAVPGLVLGYVGIAAAVGLGVLLVLSLLLPFAFLAVFPFVTPL
jgi:hypothetical protein